MVIGVHSASRDNAEALPETKRMKDDAADYVSASDSLSNSFSLNSVRSLSFIHRYVCAVLTELSFRNFSG